MIIPNQSNTVSDYLIAHPECRKVLLKFRHGMGDAFMFYAQALPALKKKFPYIDFSFSTHLGQEEIFGKYSDDEKDYDAAFEFHFPCSEWDPGDESKCEKCCRVECGVEPVKEDYSLPKKYQSPLVGMHLISTCLPNTNCPEEYAKRLWDQFCEEGLVPIDTYMRHYFANHGEMSKYITRRIDDIPATMPKLMGILSSCCGMASIASGNWLAAMAVLPPERVLFIDTKNLGAKKYTKLPVWEVNALKPYDKYKIHDFIECLKKPF